MLLIVLGNPNPVGIHPTAIGLGVGLGRDETKLGAYPFALTHLEELAAVLELLAVMTIGKLHHRLAAMRGSSFYVADAQTQVDIFVDAWFIVSLILCCGL